jgi:formamidopyrimidine-DNA glycosylase
MPELPEVEAARRLLVEHCAEKAVSECIAVEAGGHARDGEFDCIVFDDAEASADAVSAALVGKRLVAVHRRGKQLWLELSSPPHLLAHFGMTGAFVVRGVAPLQYQEFKVRDETWPPRFTKLELAFGETRLAFCDPRRLGRLRLRVSPETEEPLASLAPDPLLHPISVARCVEVLRAKGCTVKALLLDQAALVSGVGNWCARHRPSPSPLSRSCSRRGATASAGRMAPAAWRHPLDAYDAPLARVFRVADEVLFHAGIHPEATCSSLSDAQIGALHASLLHIVGDAVRANADARKFPPDWLFHYRWGKGARGTSVPGPRGGSITFLTVGGRTSAVVLSRQRKGELGKPEAPRKAAKPKAQHKGSSGGSARGVAVEPAPAAAESSRKRERGQRDNQARAEPEKNQRSRSRPAEGGDADGSGRRRSGRVNNT